MARPRGAVKKAEVELVESRTIDDLKIGDAAEFSKTITEVDIAMFAAISGDFNPLHVDAEYAKTSQFGARVAHGPITLSLCAGILGMRLPGLGTIAVSNQIRYRRPVYIGDTVKTRVEVAALDHERNRATMALLWTNQEDVVVAEGEAVVMPPKTSEL
jgi:3-hydroxybutyryl-CoA dehydratase